MSRLFALLVLVACIAAASAQYYGGYSGLGYGGAYYPGAYSSSYYGNGYSGGLGYGGFGYGGIGGLAYYKK